MENIQTRFVTVVVKGKKVKYLEKYLVDMSSSFFLDN